MEKKLPSNSVRGRIRAYIERHAPMLGDDVLEIGSRMHDVRAWWIPNRYLATGKWLSTDMQDGMNVDQVLSIEDLPGQYSDRFTGILCSEVLEHVRRPWLALPKLYDSIAPGGSLIITTLFCFPIHAYPNDFFRYSAAGLSGLLEDSGFIDIQTEYAGNVPIMLNDHGEQGQVRKDTPIHIFANARKPC